MVVKFFLMKYLLDDILGRYGGEVFLDEVSCVWFLIMICWWSFSWWSIFSMNSYYDMVVKFFLTKYLLYDFLGRYGGEVFLDEVSSVWFLVKIWWWSFSWQSIFSMIFYYDMLVKFFLTKYLQYDFLLRYGGEVFLDEVSSVWFLITICWWSFSWRRIFCMISF
jgi:hypothetical protein